MAENALHENYRDLTTGRIGGKLIRFALPVIAANLLQALYSLVDMAIVGHYDLAPGMSAVNIGGSIIQIIGCWPASGCKTEGGRHKSRRNRFQHTIRHGSGFYCRYADFPHAAAARHEHHRSGL